MKHFVFSLVFLLLPCVATAQVKDLVGTGCLNAGTTPNFGSTRIGQTINISSTQLPCNSPGTSGFVLLGLTCTFAPPLSIGCFNNPCIILVPDLVFSRPISYHLPINIPNNVGLIGFKFCAQGGCLSTFGGSCIFPLNQAIEVTVQL